MHTDKHRHVIGDRHAQREREIFTTAVDGARLYMMILNKKRVRRIDGKSTGLFLDTFIGRFCQRLD